MSLIGCGQATVKLADRLGEGRGRRSYVFSKLRPSQLQKQHLDLDVNELNQFFGHKASPSSSSFSRLPSGQTLR